MNLLEPESIAVIGASADAGSVGHEIFKNLLTQGFKGAVYPVNPKRNEILGVKTYASVTEIKKPIEMAVIVVPAKIVPAVLLECGEKNIPSAVIISAGFKEVHTKEGEKLEAEVAAIAKEHGIQVLGPNCLGILRPRLKMNASFAAEIPPQGNIALISQSGATVVAVMDAAKTLGIGFSFVTSIGNKAVVDECDMLEVALADKETKVIGMYLENIERGQLFLEAATKTVQKKPVVLLKAGVSELGKKAAASHTGALAGADAGVEALCKQSGILRAHTLQEFLDLVETLSTGPQLPSDNIAIITNAGGPGILATDAAEKRGLTLPGLTKSIEQKLQVSLPEAASTRNPIDVIGDAGADRYKAALDACGDDPHIDGVALLLTPQVMTPSLDIAKHIASWKREHPMMPIVTCFMGEKHVEKARAHLQQAGVPSFETPERAVEMLAALRAKKSKPQKKLTLNTKRAKAAQALIGKSKGLLDETTITKICELYSIPLPRQQLASSKDQAVKIAHEIGYPVVLKISSPDILHKTDIGGIKANINTDEEVRETFDEMLKSVKDHQPKATIRGVLVQQMLPPGNEFIVGATKDPAFGHLIMAGLGGIYAELLEDTAFRIAPIQEEDAYVLLSELQSWKVLIGARGKKQLAIDDLSKLICTISTLVTECPEIKDIDCNPVLVSEAGIVVIDMKIVL